MELKEVIAQNVRRLRQEKNFTLQFLADKTGLHVQTLSKIERTPQNVTVDVLERLADAFEVRVIDLLRETESESISDLLSTISNLATKARARLDKL